MLIPEKACDAPVRRWRPETAGSQTRPKRAEQLEDATNRTELGPAMAR